jgi:hypothetical protein
VKLPKQDKGIQMNTWKVIFKLICGFLVSCYFYTYLSNILVYSIFRETVKFF